MILRFPLSDLPSLSSRYIEGMNPRDRRLTATIEQAVFPSYRGKGYLTKDEFLTVCAWKTPRTSKWCGTNEEEVIREVSALVFTTKSEVLRIQSWTMLAGVKWPTASVFLHFLYADQYPILDYRALWSLGIPKPPPYTFSFWMEYVTCCRALAQKTNVSMRVLDQALWKYSQENQTKSPRGLK
ncbi:MAG: hypothetical protein WCK89_05205 [bacterium]